jgi:hypothetical protein
MRGVRGFVLGACGWRTERSTGVDGFAVAGGRICGRGANGERAQGLSLGVLRRQGRGGCLARSAHVPV